MNSSRKIKILVFLSLAFAFRFFFGLHCPQVTDAEDYRQTYLIGLKCYTTHTWPYFGPDVHGPDNAFTTQMPGALEGLLIASALKIWPAPESPYLLLNLLSFLGLSLLAWYGCKRLPGLSPWLVFAWIFIAPWATHYSTQVINPSFAYLGSCLFFVGFMETIPALSLKVLSARLANLFMGFGFFWVMQLHMSWVIFIPFLIVSFYFQCLTGQAKTALVFGFLGALPPLALLLPTYLHYGFQTSKDVHGFMSGLNLSNVKAFPSLLAWFLSMASFEMPRFVGDNLRERVGYFFDTPWLFLPGFFLWAAGLFQPVGLLILWFFKKHPQPDWKAVKFLALATLLLLFACFLFTPNQPAPFRILLTFPNAMIYSLYAWSLLASKPFWKVIGIIFVISGVYFQVGYTIKNRTVHSSLYDQKRELIAKAIEEKNYRILGERLPGSLY
jgi:hypothetical protein